jgi:hypothetical protein
MMDATEFRRRAQECMGLLKKMSPESHPMLLSIAEAWMALAHNAERNDQSAGNAPSTESLQ